jgi:hypothetical protein
MKTDIIIMANCLCGKKVKCHKEIMKQDYRYSEYWRGHCKCGIVYIIEANTNKEALKDTPDKKIRITSKKIRTSWLRRKGVTSSWDFSEKK